eukprot:gb/GEZN01003866.1/.p1 GENE.gb/GEZN01003866.1/~~gb/GEZN01003866.1/.p1  ORF type:complete len:583 (+),score=58.52 gb/GEZN01003866.1/:288-2036(+)
MVLRSCASSLSNALLLLLLLPRPLPPHFSASPSCASFSSSPSTSWSSPSSFSFSWLFGKRNANSCYISAGFADAKMNEVFQGQFKERLRRLKEGPPRMEHIRGNFNEGPPIPPMNNRQEEYQREWKERMIHRFSANATVSRRDIVTAAPWKRPPNFDAAEILLDRLPETWMPSLFQDKNSKGTHLNARAPLIKSNSLVDNPAVSDIGSTLLPPVEHFKGPMARTEDLSYSFPVDFVLTWINGSHPRLEQSASHSEARQNQRDPKGFLARVRKRSRDYGALKYAIRSIEKYAPWYNHIYLVSKWRFRPTWMKEYTPRLTIVSEEDLLPKGSPTIFNSNVVDSLFGRIPGLSECFVYMNDDYLIVAPTEKQIWCSPTQLPVVFLARGRKYVGKEKTRSRSIWHKELAFTNEALNRVVGVAKGRLNTAHGPYAMCKEAFTVMYSEMQLELDVMYRGAIVRMNDDLQIPFCAGHVAREILGAPYTQDIAVYYQEFKPEDLDNIKKDFGAVFNPKGKGKHFTTACFNDGLGKGNMPAQKLQAMIDKIVDIYETYFPPEANSQGELTVGVFEKDVTKTRVYVAIDDFN